MDALMWGVTGQARVTRPILERCGHRVILLADNNPTAASPFADLPLIYSCREIRQIVKSYGDRGEALSFLVAIGGTSGQDRKQISEELESWGAVPLPAMHPSAVCGTSIAVGKGGQILMGACIGEGVSIGNWSIVNTNASVDHDCRLGEGVHIMPGATLAGEVQVDDFAAVGSNATILPRVRIGRNAIIGAGSVVTRDVPPGFIVMGNPARGRDGPSAEAEEPVF